MKNLISVLTAVSLCSSAAFANKQIECDLNQKGLKSVVITTGSPGGVDLEFNNGDIENLSPVKGVGGEFGEIIFPDRIIDNSAPREKSFVLVRSARLGEIKIAFICKANTISCDTRGGGLSQEAFVAFRIGGDLMRYDGISNSFCRRTILNN